MNQTLLEIAHQHASTPICERSSVSSKEVTAAPGVCQAAAQTKKTCSSVYYNLSFLIPFTAVTSMYAIDCNNCMGVAVLAGTLAGGLGYTLYKLTKMVRHR